VNESKPDRRAGQQRVRKQQVQIAIHGVKLMQFVFAVNVFDRWFCLILLFFDIPLHLRPQW
jgi:hypothetical protein